MNLRIIIKTSIIILIALLIFSCDDYCEMTDYESYLPLKVGNMWYFNNNETREVIGKSNFDGQQYFDILITMVNNEGKVTTNHFFYNFEKSKLYQYTDNNKVLIADFSLEKGDEVQQLNTGFNVSVLSDDPNEFTFFYNHPEWADEEYQVTFKKDVGIISECSLAWGWCTDLTDYELQ